MKKKSYIIYFMCLFEWYKESSLNKKGAFNGSGLFESQLNQVDLFKSNACLLEKHKA